VSSCGIRVAAVYRVSFVVVTRLPAHGLLLLCSAVVQVNSLSSGQASAFNTTACHSSHSRDHRYPLAAWKGSCWWTCTKMILERRQSVCASQLGPSRSDRHPQQQEKRRSASSWGWAGALVDHPPHLRAFHWVGCTSGACIRLRANPVCNRPGVLVMMEFSFLVPTALHML
jgi:hypothetical protein